MMTILKGSVKVSTTIAAPRAAVWLELEQIEDHVIWMFDAVAIRFLGEQHRCVGTECECDTKVGPFRLTDVMKITQWDPERLMSAQHLGAVSGTGSFTLREDTAETSTLEREEDLGFPWWLGWNLGATVARPILAVLWKNSLRCFQEVVVRGATQ